MAKTVDGYGERWSTGDLPARFSGLAAVHEGRPGNPQRLCLRAVLPAC